MDRIIEFVTNHYILVFAFLALWGAFFVIESRRGGKAITPQFATNLVNQKDAVIVDVRAAGAEELGPGAPGRFLFSGSPLLIAMEQHVRAAAAAPGSRAIDVGSGSGRDAALLCCQYGFDFVCALDRDGRALSRWTRLLDGIRCLPSRAWPSRRRFARRATSPQLLHRSPGRGTSSTWRGS